MVIVGGVNVLLTPTGFISFDKTGMLAKDGHCKTLDKEANGYVRGEGVGAILLKPISKAKEDNDHIYAVIKGSAVNHSGHANSLTAPNPNAQAEVIIEAWKKSGIDPSNISYIEIHGTGTNLGDPIELNGLKKAFKELYKKNIKEFPKTPNCGIGSVKSNIGHLESAAGIAGVFKVVLSMKHGQIPGNLHFNELNPQIQLEDSPFYIVNKTLSWNSPKIAGVSSFGFGGVNSHIVLEEYTSTRPKIDTSEPQIIILSAKNRNRLKEYASNLIKFVDNNPYTSLIEIAYTLQIGREEMEERLAFIAFSTSEVKEKLSTYLLNDQIDSIYQGNIKENSANKELFIEGEEGIEFLHKIILQKKLSKIIRLWISGVEIDWKLFYTNNLPNKISLPTYPFEKNKYWIPKNDEVKKVNELYSKNIFENKSINNINSTDKRKYIKNNKNNSFEINSNDNFEYVINYLLDLVENILKIDKNNIDLDTNINEYGFDSILFNQYRKKINDKFDINIDLDVFFQYSSITNLASYISEHFKEKFDNCYKNLRNVNDQKIYNFPDNIGSKSFEEIDILPYVRRSSNNLVLSSARYNLNNQIVGKLFVDENHTYFFDHALDHVTGVLLLEGIFQLIDSYVMYTSQRLNYMDFYIELLDISFHKFCEKYYPIIVKLDIKATEENTQSFNISILQINDLICSGVIKLVYLNKIMSADNKKISKNSLTQKTDKKLVHKKYDENVLVSSLMKDKNQQYYCKMINPSQDHILSNNGSSNLYSLLYFIEGTKQFLTQAAHILQKTDFDTYMNLLSVYVKVYKPILLNIPIILKDNEEYANNKDPIVSKCKKITLLHNKDILGEITFLGQIVDEKTYKSQRFKK